MDSQNNIDKIEITQLSRFIGEGFTTHTVDFYLHFPTELDATLAEVELLNLQFSCTVSESGYAKKWFCEATKEMEVSAKRLNGIRKWMGHLATKYNGTFDGWGMEV